MNYAVRVQQNEQTPDESPVQYRKQKFGDPGRYFCQGIVLATLQARLGGHATLGVFVRAYAKHNGDYTAAKCHARNRIRTDYREYIHGGDLPYYVMRTYDLMYPA